MIYRYFFILCCFMLSACSVPTTQRYAISADNNSIIKSFKSNNIGFSTFTQPAGFSSTCRAVGPILVADGLTHSQYIQKAFEDEFKFAEAYTAIKPRIVINGDIKKMEFSSTKSLLQGYWFIAVNLRSSNGKELMVEENYDFESGFGGLEACGNTAKAFSNAVQNLVGKAVGNPRFPELLTSGNAVYPVVSNEYSLKNKSQNEISVNGLMAARVTEISSSGSDERLNDLNLIPYIGEKGRQGYSQWLTKPFPRAYAVSPQGSWAAAWGENPSDTSMPKDPRDRAIAMCSRNLQNKCTLYAVDEAVVWQKSAK